MPTCSHITLSSLSLCRTVYNMYGQKAVERQTYAFFVADEVYAKYSSFASAKVKNALKVSQAAEIVGDNNAPNDAPALAHLQRSIGYPIPRIPCMSAIGVQTRSTN